MTAIPSEIQNKVQARPFVQEIKLQEAHLISFDEPPKFLGSLLELLLFQQLLVLFFALLAFVGFLDLADELLFFLGQALIGKCHLHAVHFDRWLWNDLGYLDSGWRCWTSGLILVARI